MEDVGVLGKGEFWPRMAEVKERGTKEVEGETGEGGESYELLVNPLAVIAIVYSCTPLLASPRERTTTIAPLLM
jgi:hypothetical protein